MSERAGDWLPAAACCTGPRPTAHFSDLPPHHQEQIVRLAFLAAATVTYGIILGLLARPIESRSLQAGAALPHGAPPRSVLLEARGATPVESVSRPRATAQAAPTRADVDLVPAAAPPQPERRGNVFSRFFRGVWRSVQAPVKAESM